MDTSWHAEAIELAAAGRSVPKIAEELGVPLSTVHSHMRRRPEFGAEIRKHVPVPASRSLSPEKVGQVLALLRRGHPLKRIARDLQIPEALLYKRARTDPDFKAAAEAARAQARKGISTEQVALLLKELHRGATLDQACGNVGTSYWALRTLREADPDLDATILRLLSERPHPKLVRTDEVVLRVVTLLANGATEAEIAEQTGVGPLTQRRCVQDVAARVGGRNRIHTIALAVAAGLIQVPDPKRTERRQP
jgi:DNA-binding NarL/FixJ family response regulator